MRGWIKVGLTLKGHWTDLLIPLRSVRKEKSNAELLYARHKLRAGKCHFRSARKRAMNEQLNDGN